MIQGYLQMFLTSQVAVRYSLRALLRKLYVRNIYNNPLYESNKCSIEMFIKLALTSFFKRQHCKLHWLDKDSDKHQSQFDELFN
jgi:hypothetical protein